jgi:hypothetical protein
MRRLGAGICAAVVGTITAMTLGSGTASADTLLNDYTVQLGQYSIPATPAAGFVGGDALPKIPGTLGNPTELFMTDGGSTSQVLAVPGGTSAWGTQVRTEQATGSSGQIWRFQLIGWIGLKTRTSTQIATFGNPAGLLQKTPVYKIINYHADGSHTCLDGSGGNPTAWTAIDSYGCDPNETNQTNQLWVVENTIQDNSMIYPNGAEYSFTPGNPNTTPFFPAWASEPLQQNPWHGLGGVYGSQPTVIQNVATLVANGFDTTTSPMLSAATTLHGHNSAAVVAPQEWPVSTANSTWVVNDTTPRPVPPPTGPADTGGGKQSCSMFQCLLYG